MNAGMLTTLANYRAEFLDDLIPMWRRSFEAREEARREAEPGL